MRCRLLSELFPPLEHAQLPRQRHGIDVLLRHDIPAPIEDIVVAKVGPQSGATGCLS